MMPGVVHRSPGIYHTAEENPGKPQLGNHLMKTLRSVIASNGFPCLQMMPVGSYSTLEEEKERKKEGNDEGEEE